MELHRELGYGQPNGSPRRAILALFFRTSGWYTVMTKAITTVSQTDSLTVQPK